MNKISSIKQGQIQWSLFVRTLRNEYLELTQQELAEKLKISSSLTVSKWERGESEPRLRCKRALKTIAAKSGYDENDWPKKELNH